MKDQIHNDEAPGAGSNQKQARARPEAGEISLGSARKPNLHGDEPLLTRGD